MANGKEEKECKCYCCEEETTCVEVDGDMPCRECEDAFYVEEEFMRQYEAGEISEEVTDFMLFNEDID